MRSRCDTKDMMREMQSRCDMRDVIPEMQLVKCKMRDADQMQLLSEIVQLCLFGIFGGLFGPYNVISFESRRAL